MLKRIMCIVGELPIAPSNSADRLSMCADRPLDFIFRKVVLRNGNEAPLNAAVTEHKSITELADGQYGPEGIKAFRLLYRHCVGESLSAEENAELTKWGLLQEDGVVASLKRDVVLSICRVDKNELRLEDSPFVKPEDVHDAKAIAAMADEYFRQTLVRLVRAKAAGGKVHNEFIEHAFQQAMKTIYPNYDRSDLPWAERFQRGDDQQKRQ